MQVQSLGQEDPLEKRMANPSNIFSWDIPWTEKPGGLQPLGLPAQGVTKSWTGLSGLDQKYFMMLESAAQ